MFNKLFRATLSTSATLGMRFGVDQCRRRFWHRWCAGLLTVGIILEQLKQLNRDKHLLHGAVSSWTASVASVPFATRTA